MTALLVTAFLVGLAGGVHCMAMCGGIVTALGLREPKGRPVAGADGARRSLSMAGLSRQFSYSLGRVTTYTCAGAVAGAVGGLGLRASGVLPVQLMLLVVANALIILLGLHLAGFGNLVLAFERAGAVAWRGLKRIGARLAPADTGPGRVAVGLTWGMLPCGLVYSVLATALVAGSAARGAMVMAAFGLGTLPNLLAAGLAAETLRRLVRGPKARRVAGVAIILLGVVGLARIPGLPEHVRHGMHMLH
jgi:sulfite exporter TauE/SafE